MIHDPISAWVEKSKMIPPTSNYEGVKVIRRPQAPSTGMMIMEMAERIRPWLLKMFEGVRDESGMLLQPAHIRGMALNVAQDLVKRAEEGK